MTSPADAVGTQRAAPRPARFGVRLAGVLAALLLAGLAAAPAAAAAPWDCTDAPVPEVPSRGVVSYFETPPSEPPPPGDPFVEGSGTTIYEQYGYAGLRFTTYDLGCGPDVARSPDAVVGSAIANWVFNVAKLFVSATEAVLSAAFDPQLLATFDPLVVSAVDALRTAVFEQWVFVALAATGAMLVLRARKASLASTAAAVGWALLVLVLATAVFRWPLAAGQAADRTVTSTLGAVYTGFSGADPDPQRATDGSLSPAGRSASNLHEAVLYQAWLTGTFGDANSDTARRHGPEIFDAQALTWAEAETLREDPSQAQELFDAKAEQFSAAASRVQDTDPDAYAYLTGQRSDARVGAALIANFAALCALPFLLLSALLVMGALIIVRLGVMLFPAFATLGVFPVMRPLVTGIGNTLAAAVINAIMFGIGASVMVAGVGLLLDPGSSLPPWLAVVLVGLLTVVLWVLLRPFRRLTTMVTPGHGFFADGAGAVSAGGRRVRRSGARLVHSGVGHAIGRVLTDRVSQDEQADESAAERGDERPGAGAEPASAGPRAETVSLPHPGEQARPAGRPPAASDAPGPPAQPLSPPLPAARTATPGQLGATPGHPGTTPGPGATTSPSTADDAALRPAAASNGSRATAAGAGVPAGHAPRADGPSETDLWRPSTAESERMPDAVEPQEVDGEEAHVLYRPSRDAAVVDRGRA